ncbi:hypothetical protein [uncultured Pedobacter sp.]|uniref:hypothetical protein n=1 Tax=uncultured Pedobacter sp. TaxID=246139 RepID=UPI0025D52BF5|nr:hypothetical protein [uncultured Pedobacter sp.]
MAGSAPLSGTSSGEGPEALPGNRVYLTWAGAWKTDRCSLKFTEVVSFLASVDFESTADFAKKIEVPACIAGRNGGAE